MHPAHAEPDPGWPEPVGESEETHVAGARDDDPVHLDPFHEGLEDGLASRRLGQRFVEAHADVVGGRDAEDSALPAGVDGLEHGRQPGYRDRVVHVVGGAERLVRRLRDSRGRQCAPHRELVRHQLRRRAPDPGQAELLGDGGDDWDGPIRRDRQDAVDAVPSTNLRDRGDVREVDDLGDVGGREARRVLVAVDRDDAQVAGPRVLDRAPLVAPRADEEDGLHGADGKAPAATNAARRQQPGRERSQRPMWQPFSLENDAHTRLPSTTPITRAFCGPP